MKARDLQLGVIAIKWALKKLELRDDVEVEAAVADCQVALDEVIQSFDNLTAIEEVQQLSIV